jgi:FKBP-type peptidyl-prolyl cis-trans isomerase
MSTPGIDWTDIVTGTGALAEGDVWVRIRVRVFLNKGEEVARLWGPTEDGLCFRLTNREIIPGLRYALDGMRAGDRRQAAISPHLAFGEAGIPGKIPPQALLRVDLELLEVGQPGQPMPIPPELRQGRFLNIIACQGFTITMKPDEG